MPELYDSDALAIAALRGLRVGLIGNATSVEAEWRHYVDVLREQMDVKLVSLFAPEHSFYGEMDEQVASMEDPRTGLTVHSL